MTSIMFVNEEKKALVREWADRFREKLGSTTSRSVETSFGATHVLVDGPEDGPPLVVVHGALASSAHVMGELGPLRKTRRVYAIDVVGQSVLSEDRRIDVRGDDYGRWIVEVTKALGLASFDLYGVSWGGFVALRAARLAGHTLKHLVLLVPAGVVAGSAWVGFREVGWPMLTYRWFPNKARLERVAAGLFTTPDPDWLAWFGDAVLAYKLDMRVPPRATPEELAEVKCPVLVFGGEHDSSFPGQALIDRMKVLLPQAETELL
jgi:2-hydroxy-6-oxonona-2,4-dienedioate hydrolase